MPSVGPDERVRSKVNNSNLPGGPQPPESLSRPSRPTVQHVCLSRYPAICMCTGAPVCVCVCVHACVCV